MCNVALCYSLIVLSVQFDKNKKFESLMASDIFVLSGTVGNTYDNAKGLFHWAGY